MRIGILGAGHIGGTLAELWTRAGHDVVLASSDPSELTGLVARLGPHASAGTVSEAVAAGDVVLVALPGGVVMDVLEQAGSLGGTVMIHAANAFARGGSPGLPLAALVARFPTARWVRAYNTLQARVLGEQNHADPALVQFLSGDDTDAKAVVAGLVRDSGFAPLDLGGVADSPLQDPGSTLWNNPLTEEQARAALASARHASAEDGGDPLDRAWADLAKNGPTEPAWWLERITRSVFEAGLSWRVVAAKWDGFRKDFAGFDPAAVAAIGDEELARIQSDPAVIRNAAKIAATVRNAGALLALIDQHGSVPAYLAGFPDGHAAAADLRTRFLYLGETGTWRLLVGAQRDAQGGR